MSNDPFELKGKVPAGKAYQWVTIQVLGKADDTQLRRATNGGWKPVPASRHKKMKRSGKRIVVRGQLLMERTIVESEAARAREVDSALRMFTDHPAHIQPGERYHGGHPFKSLPAVEYIKPDGSYWKKKEENKAYLEEYGGVVSVEIKIELSESEIDAAAILNMHVSKYAQNKIMLISQLFSEQCVLEEAKPGVFKFKRLKIVSESI